VLELGLGMQGGARGWVVGRAAFGVLLLPGFGVGSSSPQISGHPTSMCNAGVQRGFPCDVTNGSHIVFQNNETAAMFAS